MNANPLLDFSGLPRFDEIKPEHITPAMDELLSSAQNVITKVGTSTEAATWDNVFEPIIAATEKIDDTWRAIGHMKAVVNSEDLRKAYNENLPKLSRFFSELGQNMQLFARYKELETSGNTGNWTQAKRKCLENALRDFRLSGAELADKEKDRFREIEEKTSELASKFNDNVLDATDAFSLIIENKAELDGIPDDVMTMYKAEAAKEGKDGYKLTLQMPSFLPLMQYCSNRSLREKLYAAYNKKASEFEPSQWDNTEIIRQRLKLLKEKAELLGFKNYSELSVNTKMANTPQEVIDFIRNLAGKSKPFADKEFQALEDYAQKHLGLNSVQPWDVYYASEKMREALYAFSDNEVKQYFPEDKVLKGLFNLVNTLFNVDIVPAEARVWHKDVHYYEIQKDDKVIAAFYFDLYAREGKRAGAWMNSTKSRRLFPNGDFQIPVAYLTCNFSPAVGDKSALFTHREVTTLFHEFGHGLQHMLTQINEVPVAGINGVEWDAVELASQIMENFCWEWDVLQKMSGHIDTGEPIPRTLFDKMLKAKNYNSGMAMVRQLEFGLFDMLLYTDFDADNGDWLKLLKDVQDEVAVIKAPDYSRFPNSFSHIFAGGYSAGYYSYKWAEVLSADAYSAFEDAGGANPETGQKYWNEVLAVGGSRPAAESFKAFRGREPGIDALLRHNGLVS